MLGTNMVENIQPKDRALHYSQQHTHTRARTSKRYSLCIGSS